MKCPENVLKSTEIEIEIEIRWERTYTYISGDSSPICKRHLESMLNGDKTYVMTEGIQTFAHYRQTYKAKQFLLRVLFIIGFVLFTRFYFQSLLP